jgi:arginase
MEVIGVPFDLCGQRPGSRLGPEAMRLGGLVESLKNSGFNVRDGGDIPTLPQGEGDIPGGLKNFTPAFDCLRTLKARVAHSMRAKLTPLVIGGDHFTAVGAVSGAMEVCGPDLSLIWIDAHADLNTPATSPSGNLHGMPISALLGLPSGVSGIQDKQWRELTCGLVPDEKLRPERCAWYGLREADPGEQAVLRNLPGRHVATMHDIDRFGIVACLYRFDRWMRDSGSKSLWISFDVDVLDPFLAPGTGTAVRGGISYREMHIFGEVLYEILAAEDCPYKLVGLDIVEINPLFDTNNMTALAAVEWISSLFGKRILGPRV